MTEQHYEAPVDLPADEVYQYAADPANLPDALTGGAIGWCDTDDAAKSVRWGEEGRSRHSGELVVHDESADRCRVVVRSHHDGDLAEGVAELAHGAAARTDSFRADHQHGWAG